MLMLEHCKHGGVRHHEALERRYIRSEFISGSVRCCIERGERLVVHIVNDSLVEIIERVKNWEGVLAERSSRCCNILIRRLRIHTLLTQADLIVAVVEVHVGMACFDVWKWHFLHSTTAVKIDLIVFALSVCVLGVATADVIRIAEEVILLQLLVGDGWDGTKR